MDFLGKTDESWKQSFTIRADSISKLESLFGSWQAYMHKEMTCMQFHSLLTRINGIHLLARLNGAHTVQRSKHDSMILITVAHWTHSLSWTALKRKSMEASLLSLLQQI